MNSEIKEQTEITIYTNYQFKYTGTIIDETPTYLIIHDKISQTKRYLNKKTITNIEVNEEQNERNNPKRNTQTN